MRNSERTDSMTAIRLSSPNGSFVARIIVPAVMALLCTLCAQRAAVAQAPLLLISKTHTGNFTQGQQGIYSLEITNAGGATAAGVPVQVLDFPPTGMTVKSMSGIGWQCTTGASNSCVRNDIL